MEERSTVVPIKFDDYDFVLAFQFNVFNKFRKLIDVPRAVGSVTATIKATDSLESPVRIDLTIDDCSKVLLKSTIKASQSTSNNFGLNGSIFCLRPHNVWTSRFYDRIGDW